MVKRLYPPNDRDTQTKPRSGGSIDPDDAPSQDSAINRATRLIEALFSHVGVFWVGVVAAVAAFCGNCWFYFGVFFESFGVAFLLAAPLALLVSFGTSAFQLMSKVQTATARLALHQLFVAGIKPNVVPVIDPNTTTDYKNLIADYRDAELKRREFFKLCRNLSFAFEAFMGIMFIGNIGAGGAALFSLLMFGASIVGVNWGVHFALKAAEDELPPHIADQLKGLLENDGKTLSLSRL